MANKCKSQDTKEKKWWKFQKSICFFGENLGKNWTHHVIYKQEPSDKFSSAQGKKSRKIPYKHHVKVKSFAISLT